MTEKNEIKDVVEALVKLRIAVESLNPDPAQTIAQYRDHVGKMLSASKELTSSTKALANATWALFIAAALTGLLVLLQVLIALKVIAR